MYERFYGLHTNPFRLTPDPRFFFASGTHNGALAYLRYGISQGEGFIVVTGDSGAGKTELTRMLVTETQHREAVIAELAIPSLEPDEMLYAISDAFGLTRCGDKAATLKHLHEFMLECVRSGRRVIVMIDEAQNLRDESIEELRMLSNLQFHDRALFQCILLGTPELRQKCDRGVADLLRERVIAAYRLRPLLPSEVTEYVQHRLRCAGWKGDPRFPDAAYAAVARHSAGNPRKVNLICQRLLLCGCMEKSHVLTDEIIALVIQELHDEGLGETFAADAPAYTRGSATRQPEVSRGSPRHAGPAMPRSDTMHAAVPKPAGNLAGIGVAPAATAWPERLVVPGKIVAGSVALALLTVVVADNTPETRPMASPSMVVAGAVLGDVRSPPREQPAPTAQVRAHKTAPTHRMESPPQGDPNVIGAIRPVGADKPALAAADTDARGSVTAPAPHANENEKPSTLPAQRSSVENERPSVSTVDDDAYPRQVADGHASDTTPTAPAPKVASSDLRPAEQATANALSVQSSAAQQGSASKNSTHGAGKAAAGSRSAGASRPKPSRTPAGAVASASGAPASLASPDGANVTAEAAPSDAIPRNELDDLVAQFTAAYQEGDLDHLVRLLADDVKTNDAAGRRGVTDEYRKLFDITEARNMVVTDIRWRESGETLKGDGEFAVTVRPRGKAAGQSYMGRIVLGVKRLDDNIVISELHHTYY